MRIAELEDDGSRLQWRRSQYRLALQQLEAVQDLKEDVEHVRGSLSIQGRTLEEVQDSLSYQDKTTEEVQETLNDQRRAIGHMQETLNDQSEIIQELRGAALDQNTFAKSLETRFARMEASIERQYDYLFQLLAAKAGKRSSDEVEQTRAPLSWIPPTVAESCEEEHTKHLDHLCRICGITRFVREPEDSIRAWERDTREKLERAKIGRTLWTSVAVRAFKGDALHWWQRQTKESREVPWESLIAALNEQFPFELQNEKLRILRKDIKDYFRDERNRVQREQALQSSNRR